MNTKYSDDRKEVIETFSLLLETAIPLIQEGKVLTESIWQQIEEKTGKLPFSVKAQVFAELDSAIKTSRTTKELEEKLEILL